MLWAHTQMILLKTKLYFEDASLAGWPDLLQIFEGKLFTLRRNSVCGTEDINQLLRKSKAKFDRFFS